MPEYRRHYVKGGTYFFTVVTDGRRHFLTEPASRTLLRSAIEHVRKARPFDIVAWFLLPDHLHAIWTLPPDDDDFSLRWAQIKETFTRMYLKSGGQDGSPTASRRRHRERTVWQRRFWEHCCRDEDDLKRCLDYIHWNPVKHGLVSRVVDYEWSTFHRYMAIGEYARDWGSVDPCPEFDDPEWE